MTIDLSANSNLEYLNMNYILLYHMLVMYDEKMLEGSTTTNQELGGFAVMDSSEVDGRDSLEVTPDIISNNDHEQAVFVKREEEVEI